MEDIQELVNAIVNDPILSEKTYTYLILGTQNAFTSGYYRMIEDQYFSYDGDMTIHLFDKYINKNTDIMQGKGVLCIKVSKGILMEYGLVNDMNPEIYDMDALELTMYQRYGLKPVEEDRKEVLQQSLKAEKVKDTLVFACYMNDMEGIRTLAANAKKSHLDKVLKNRGTSLQFCSRHNNIEAFRLLAEKGATVGKRALTRTPLEIAFQYSQDIVNYIQSDFPEVYQKEVGKKGFTIARHCTDEYLLEGILRSGGDVNQEGKPFPPLHNFADYNNVVAMRFLLNNGADQESRNDCKQTALHRAVSAENADAIKVLLEYGVDLYAKDRDGTTPIDLAQVCVDQTIFKMMRGAQQA
ncbi:ankyrin repeat domain-containing protein [Paenibacillus sp. ACRSA]|uniref:ankyrin repeat domain-containing protein n=1 Tax=Paenibacillus sp. ACRSA TaxID=2918211 RepID=UPI001EF55F35|nr:ankyrin repeat domain-containing protein [Paenibacillus sp. ACRSA]MCG7378108.1 ankyrin repeat domain-containing protein [Paenibacillus sp. ACRSA]